MVIPTLNEAGGISVTLTAADRAVREYEKSGGARGDVVVIVADGGSTDATVREAERFPGVRVIRAPQGRAEQMNAGAAGAAGSLLFLHADTHPDPDAILVLLEAMTADSSSESTAGPTLYTFTFGLRGEGAAWRRMERGVAWRTRVLGLPYGDQGLAMNRALFDSAGGFREGAGMEDLDFVLRLRGRARVRMLPAVMRTATRQWDRQGRVVGIAWNLTRLVGGVLLHTLRGGAVPLAAAPSQRTPAA